MSKQDEHEIAEFINALRPHLLPGVDEKALADDLRRLMEEVEGESPKWNPPAINALRDRNFERVNDPRLAPRRRYQ